MLRKKIRILYPILHYPPVIGGLEQWSQNIVERQPPDVEVLIVTGRVRGEPNFAKKGNVTIFRTSLFVLSDLSHSSLFYIAGAFPFIIVRSLLLSKNVDMFHCHGFVSALMGYVLSFLTRKLFIGTEQSVRWQNTFKKLACGMIYRKASVCIAASRAVAGEFKKIGVTKIEVIPNGVDLEKFSLKEQCSKCGTYDIPHRKNVGYRKSHIILSVGRLEKVKGHKYLIDAFSRIANVTGSDPVSGGVRPRLIIVGDGTERANLEAWTRELGVESAVEFAGEIPHNELAHWYHKADVFVMPSLSEGFGITAIEAMACGIPVVVSGIGGLLDIVEDKVTGFLARPGDPASLKCQILNILQNKDLQKVISNNARCRVLKYSWNNIAKSVNSIYKSTLARNEGGRSFS